MAGFRFKFDTVLRHRERVEQDRQRELVLAQAEHTEIQQQIRRLDESVQSSTADLRANHLIGVINLAYLTAHRRFVLSVQRQGAALVASLQEHEAKVNLARTALGEATRDRKVLEKLREKRHSRWREVEAHREAADLDEVAMQMSFEQQIEQASAVARPFSPGEVPS